MEFCFKHEMLKKMSEAVGFQVTETQVEDSHLELYGKANEDYAEAHLYVDFCSRSCHLDIYKIGNEPVKDYLKIKLAF